MRYRLPVLIAATVALVAVGTAPALASGGSPSHTTASFTLNGGALTLSTAAAARLSPGASGETDIVGSLGTVRVDDKRGSDTAWVVAAAATQFVGTGANATRSTSVSYTGGDATTTGTIHFDVVAGRGGEKPTKSINLVSAAVNAPVAAATVMAPDLVRGNNTATWNPTVHIGMPSNALADTYSATFTTSIL